MKREPLDRFLEKVSQAPGSACWIWRGCFDGDPRSGPNPRGQYGRFALDGYHMIAAHRASYLLFNGEIPAGLQVRHTCDNPPCVNPSHLVVGTVQDNADDAVARGREWFQKPGARSPRLGTGVGRVIAGKGSVVPATCVVCGSGTEQRVTPNRRGQAAVCPGNSRCKAVWAWRRRRGEAA